MSRLLFRRTALLGVLMPFLYFGTASATFLFRIHADNSERVHVRLASYPAPLASQRIVVFSPHPDDETLGCAGLMQQARRVGAPVSVALFTNGDGFRVAVERQFRTVHLEPDDYVRFAALRQQETRAALGRLGIDARDITFFGYPDRGLLPLWTEHWSRALPYVSPYTRHSASPYAVAQRPGVVYTGENVLEDVKSVLRRARPTDVYVTHPSDDHPDHTAASAFVALALRQLEAAGEPWARTCTLHYYLVHRGDWPVPQGMQKGDRLVPPSEMLALDTRWRERDLTPAEIDRKSESILAYRSQTAVMKRFLVSFARRNELFGDLRPIQVPSVPDRTVQPDGELREWVHLAPVVLDPVNDNLLRDFQEGADVRAIYACRDTANLYLRIDTYGRISPRATFEIGLRTFRGTAGESAMLRVTAQPPNDVVPPGVRVSYHPTCLELAVPLPLLRNASLAALNVETRFAGLQVDRTGYRFLDL